MFLQRLKGIPASQVINAQIDAWGGRRFLMCMLVQLSANVLIWFSKIDGGEYVAIVLGITGVYVAGNTFQKNTQIRVGSTETDSELKDPQSQQPKESK